MAADANNLIWIDMEMTGLIPDTDRIIEIAMLVTDSQLNLIAEGPVLVVRQPEEPLGARQIRPDREGEGRNAGRSRRRAPGAGIPRAARAGGRLADVRQLDLPGPALPRTLDAEARGVLPLPQPRCLDAEGAGEALEARGVQGDDEAQAGQARGARRHPRIDRGAEVLPQDGDEHLMRHDA